MAWIALIDYGMGNLRSVSKALEKAGGTVRIVDRPEQTEGCAGVILPGVGNFGDGMRNLRERGFVEVVAGRWRRRFPCSESVSACR